MTDTTWLDDVFYDVRLTCEECEHPKCVGLIKRSKATILTKLEEARTQPTQDPKHPTIQEQNPHIFTPATKPLSDTKTLDEAITSIFITIDNYGTAQEARDEIKALITHQVAEATNETWEEAYNQGYNDAKNGN